MSDILVGVWSAIEDVAFVLIPFLCAIIVQERSIPLLGEINRFTKQFLVSSAFVQESVQVMVVKKQPQVKIGGIASEMLFYLLD